MPDAVEEINYTFHKGSTLGVSEFLESAKSHSNEFGSVTLDSAADFNDEAERHNLKLPADLQDAFDAMGDDAEAKKAKANITKVIFDSAANYEAEHGRSVPADIVEQALHNASGLILDSTGSDTSAHNTLSLQANSAIVAVMTTVGNGSIPFAHYAPGDRKSNESKIAILEHVAANAFGAYAANESMNGINSGKPFMNSSRVHKANPVAGSGSSAVTGKLTALQSDRDHCDQAASSVPLMSGRCVVYIEGVPVAREIDSDGGVASSIVGTFSLKSDPGTTYNVTGHVNTHNGEYSLTFTPGLDVSVDVVTEGFIDFESDEALIPSFAAKVTIKSLFCHPARAQAKVSIDSGTQMKNELGLDPFSELMMGFNIQYRNERYYRALNIARRIAEHSNVTFSLDYAAKSPNRTRASIWLDFISVIDATSQEMANKTMGYGISMLYANTNIIAQLNELSRDVWQPSGLPHRAGIYRVGRLAGKYDVYYTPDVVRQNPDGSSAEIMGIGRSNDVANNGIVAGDSVAPHIENLGKNAALGRESAFFTRGMAELNPHAHTHNSFVLFTITGMK